MVEVKIHKNAKYRKLDTLEFSFSPQGKPRLKRWDGYWGKPNAIALEDLVPGIAVVNERYEVRMMR